MAADRSLQEGRRSLGAPSRALWIAAGAGLAALAIGLPAGLAPPAERAPIDGTTLARLALALSGLIAVAVGVRGYRLPRLLPDDRLRLPFPAGDEIPRPLLWLAAITIIAAALRLYGIGGSLWLDEIITVAHASGPFRELFTTSPTLSNHLLHTLLVRGVIRVAGHAEWAIRLPAVAFGVATVPAVYALARVTLRPREALLAALILATSYTHLYFSQNSRGYAAFIFWTAVATWLLMRALAGDRARDWWGFAAASFLAGATILLGGLTLVGQAALVALVAAQVRRAGGHPWPIAFKSLVVMGLVGLALLDLYALSLPGLYQNVQPAAGEGAAPRLPTPFWRELRWGLGQAFSGPGLVALSILAVLLAPGMARFVRRYPTYCAYLAAPLMTLGAAVPLLHLFAAPRYFVWAVVPFSIGLVGSAAFWPRAGRWAAPLAAGLVVAGSLVGLRDYYAAPFQASRETVAWILRETAPEDIVVPIASARAPARYYGRPLGLFRTRTVPTVSSTEELQSIERAYAGRRIWLLTSNLPGLRRFQPDLADHIDRCYRPVREFPAKIHGVLMTVWSGPCPSAAAGEDRPPARIAGARSGP